MGNSPTKKDQMSVTYKYLLRKSPIAFKIFDDFPYPKKPKNIEIEDQFQEILKNCVLTKDQIEAIKQLNFDVKWKLICKHRYIILTGLNDYKNVRKSIAHFYAESLKNNNSMSDFDHFFSWIQKDAKEIDINSFINYGGLQILLESLEKAENCSRSTKNHEKQILILKILNYLTKFSQVIDSLINIPLSAKRIFLNFQLQNWEISKYVLQLLNDYTWKSEKGQKEVIDALNFYKVEFSKKYRLEPFMETLSCSKNIIMIESVLAFINAIIESPEEEQKRACIRSEFSSCGIKEIIGNIKEKINKEEYKMEDCNYKAYLEECQMNGNCEINEFQKEDCHSTSRTTLYFSDNEDDLFSKKQISVLKQIEIFENGFLEFCEEIDDEDSESDEDSFTSLIDENNKISRDKSKDIKSIRSFATIKNKEIDFSDVGDLFNRTRTKSLENDNYEDFLAIMQHFCLIPSNENGKKIWKKMRQALDEMNGIGKDEKLMNLSKFRKLLETKESVEELQNKITFLNTQLSIRDDEIKHLQFKLKESEFAKQTYKNSNEQIIANFLKEKETNKILNNRIIENELRSSKIIKQNELKIKKLDEKIKEISRNLSYSPLSKHSPQQNSSKLESENNNLRKEIALLKKASYNGNGLAKPNIFKLSLEKEESVISEQSIKINSSNVITFISAAVQTDFPSTEKSEDPTANYEILPSFNNNLMNINEILNNKSDNPLCDSLKKSANDFENEMLKSLKIDSVEEGAIFFGRREKSLLNKSKDQIIENLSKRIRELENLVNNIPGRISGKEEKTPKSIMINNDGDHSHRSRGPSQVTSMKTIQFKLDDSPKNNENIHKNNLEQIRDFEIIKEDEKEQRGSIMGISSSMIPKEQTKEDNKLDRRKSRRSIWIPPLNLPPPPPPLLLFPLGNASGIAHSVNDGPVKEKKIPSVPMKQICWTSVNPKCIENTIWENMNEEEVTFDFGEIEKNFTSKRPLKTQEPKNIPKTNEKNVKITLLSLTRSKNISIALSKLKMSLSAISDAVIKMDENILKLNVIGSLLEACPKEEEFSVVSAYEGDRSKLDLPEQFVLEIKNVSGFRIRLEAMQFYLTYKELVEDFSLKTEKLTDLFENILDNPKLHLLLKYVLALGNYLNGAGNRGGAFGFKLDVFDKIVDMKSVDGKKSFLSYLIELIEKNTGTSYIDPNNNEDLKIYEIGRKLPISQLLIDLSDIKKGYNLVIEAMETKTDNPFDNVEHFLKEFASVLQKNIEEFSFMMEDLTNLYKRICQYYCEDYDETPSDVFVEKIHKIWVACKKAKNNNMKEKEQIKKEEQRIKMMEAKAKAQNNKLECPEELANYIQTRRMIRRKPEFEGRRYGSILKQKLSVRFSESPIKEAQINPEDKS